MEDRDPFFRITGRSTFTFSALLFVILILWLSTGYPPRARYIPQVVAIFSLLCLSMQLVLDSSPWLSALYRKVEKEDIFRDEQIQNERETDKGTDLRLEIITYFWLLSLLAGLLIFGFLISIPFYVIFYLRFQAQLTWLKSGLYGIGTFLFIYLLFSLLFKIRLYPGFLLQLFLEV